MLTESKAFSSFAVDDVDKAQRFYGETLGLDTTRVDMGTGLLTIAHAGGGTTMVYQRPDSKPATYTVLNFPVDDVDEAVDELAGRGIEFEHYEGLGQDDKGIARDNGPEIAWFKDPAGNILSVLKPV